MSEGVRWFKTAVTSIGLTDLLDIAVVALLLYIGIAWFLRSRARFTLVALAGFGGLYLLSRALDMYLTRLAFQTVVTVVLVGAVVIFQDDLRRAAERLTTKTWFPKNNGSYRDDGAWVDVIVETMATLSRERIGALIVLKGNDHLEHYLTGGVPLGGKPSSQLLLSLFDARTPGHDGAVIIHRGRVARFGAHLPLSTNVDDSGWLGTRHAAALGLAERTDALVLVVSEESGRMRLAEDGKLLEVSSVEPLKARIEAFLLRVQPPPEERSKRVLSVFTRNLPLKAGAALAAASLWLAVVGVDREPAMRTLSVPIALKNVPDGWDITRQEPLAARVTLSGSSAAFRVLGPDEVKLQVAVPELSDGTQAIPFDRTDLQVPNDLTVRGVEPTRVVVEANRMVRVRLPIRPTLLGQLPSTLRLLSVSVTPDTVEVIAPRQRASELEHILTEPVDVGDITDAGPVPRPLMLPRGVRLVDEAPREVEVLVDVEAVGAQEG